jgi:hypothetical protein
MELAMIGQKKLWPTPRAGKTTNENQESWEKRQKAGKVATPPLPLAVKMWATPSAMDHLPQRSAEATLRLQEGQRKGRARPSNLREQVDPETMKMWPTPAAEESSSWKYTEVVDKDGNPPTHPNQSFYDKKTGRLMQKGLEQVVNMYPTPRVSDTEGGIVKNVELNNGSFSRRNKQGVRWGVKLRDAVNHLDEEEKKEQKKQRKGMWSTPTVFDSHNIQKPRKNHPGGGQVPPLCQQVMMWPTPSTMDATRSGQIRKREELSEAAKKGGCSNLREAVHDPKYLEQEKMLPTPQARDWKGPSGRSLKGLERDLPTVAQEMMPTPTARDWKGPRKPETLKKNGRLPSNSLPDKVRSEVKKSEIKLHLNPTWVEALMGFPPGWTVLGNEESQE